MLKIFTTKQAAGAVCSTMEAETIQNAVIPKNHKSRGNFKLVLVFALIYCCLFSSQINAQEEKYQRSSLAMIITTNEMNVLLKQNESKSVSEIREEVVKSWNSYPFPDKYNKHNIQTSDLGLRSEISVAKLAAAIQQKNVKQDVNELLPKIKTALKQKNVAHQLVRNWFSSKDGKMFDMEYIKEMGLYNVSEGDLNYNTAKKSAKGLAMLADAGENLINNTFVTVTEINFFSNEPVAQNLQAAADQLLRDAKKSCNTGNQLADAICQLTYSTAALVLTGIAAGIKDGYSVFSKTFLFKLKWDENTAANFYNIWGDEAAFERMNFELEYIGYQYNRSKVNAGIFSKSKNREIEVILKKVLVRNIDAAFATLQKENEVFRPSVPILEVEPSITAKIGMKEGLTGKEKFAIFEKIEDPETHKTKWKKVGITSVDKKYIWDNRYNADEKPEVIVYDKDGQPITATKFKSNAKAQQGMLLKQIGVSKSKKGKKQK